VYYEAVGTTDTALTDEEVAVRVQAGEQELFGALMERYEPKLARYGRKFLANADNIDDIVQDVFISAYQNIQSFDPARRFSPWIYRIAHNAYVNALKKNSHQPIMLFDFDALVSHTVYEDPVELEREQKEVKGMIEECLEKLPAKYKEVLLLRYYEDMDYKEIAEVLEVPTGTVSVRIMRAREALKKAWDASPHARLL
jgi:RNA polymerase sigma-70 factor (ECF subfamily)